MVLQFVVNGVVVGGIFVMGAIGLSLIYGVRNFANFAHGELMALGAYVAYTVHSQFAGFHLNIVYAAAVAFFVVSFVGILLEYTVFHRLEGRGVVAPLIASFGLFFIIQNLVRIIWSSTQRVYLLPKTFLGHPTRQGIQLAFGISLTVVQIFTLIIAVIFVTVLHILLKYTKIGKAMRATSDNFELAKVTGINTWLVIMVTWFIGAGFAAVGGVLLGLNTQLRPTMGFNILLFLFAAVILGGIGSAYGALLGGLTIGIASEVSKYLLFLNGIDSAYSPAVAFAVLVVMLIVRPQGILGGEPIAEDIRRLGMRVRKLARRIAALAR